MSTGPNPDIKSAATLGFVGAILLILGIFSSLVGLIGLILVLIALSRLSRAYNNPAIFDNALKGVIVGIIGAIIAAVIFFMVLLSGFAFNPMNPGLSATGMIVDFVILFIILYIFMIIYGMFMRNAYNQLAASSGIEDFRSTAKWYWYGALTYIIFIGAILILVANIYALLGFRKLSG